MSKSTKRFLGIFVYLFLIFLPLIVMFAFPVAEKRESWREISVALGFLGLSMAGLQFLPTARIKFFADVYDLDKVYKIHHVLSVLSVVFVFLHPTILLVKNPHTLYLLNPITAPWRAQAGIIGLVGLILLAITSVLRLDLKLDYNKWHTLHEVLALGVAVFALIHLFKVNYYLSSPAMAAAWIAEAFVWGAATIYMRLVKPIELQKQPYSVGKVVQETPDTWSVVLKPQNHEGLDFHAAQVAWLNVDTSPFTLHRNPFSISNKAHSKDLRFSINVSGDFTSTISELDKNSVVYVDGPYGNLVLEQNMDAKGFVFLAGGIGSAPIMSILNTLAEMKEKRPVYFFYGNYSLKYTAFIKELNELESKLDLKVFYVMEKSEAKFTGETGFITADYIDQNLPEDRDEFLYFICGPEGMIAAMKSNLKSLEIPSSQIEIEDYKMA